MKITSLFIVLFVAVLVYAGIERSTGVSGRTQKNGNGCTCHSPTLTAGVFVRIEGPSTISRGQTAQYTIKMSGGAAVKGGFNVAAQKGNTKCFRGRSSSIEWGINTYCSAEFC